MSYKVAMLIVSTSYGRNWKSIKETYLYNIFTKSFLKTIDKINKYIVYIGIDKGDKILDNKEEQKLIKRFSQIFKNVEFKFIILDSNIKKGHLSKMWNAIFKIAYDENCDYFYQCGDDINFKTNGWVNDSINTLKKYKNIGLTGPINNNPRILTQSFVSRRHMEIFGYYFPEEIINWCIDDWYNFVYKPSLFFPLKNHYCSNDGGNPRYIINNDPLFLHNCNNKIYNLRKFTFNLAQKHKQLIKKYILENKNKL